MDYQVLPPLSDFAARITAAWRSTIEGIFEAGRLLIEAKGKLSHGEFSRLGPLSGL